MERPSGESGGLSTRGGSEDQVENPDGDVKDRPFIQAENWPQDLPMAYRPFDCCSFEHPAGKNNVTFD